MSSCRAILALVLFLSLTGSVHAAEPWEGVPFSSDPKVLLAAANAVAPKDADEGVVVLLDEARYSFNEKGLATRTERLIFRVVEQAWAENWATIETGWSPWYEERPDVQARVVTSDGSVHMLDPKSFGTADAEDVPNIFSDTRVLEGPLPAVAAGSVVEQLITYREKNPLYEAGISRRHYFGRWVGTRRARLVLEYPTSVQLHLANRTKPVMEPKRVEANGLVTMTFEAESLPALDTTEYNLPPDVVLRSYVAFSTGRSWQDVARRYSEIVDRQIAAGTVKPAAARAPGEDVRATAARLLDRISRQIRYAGVEFGEGSIVPRTPAETLDHKYGDCKDKATLLVAMLRQAGIPAHVALLVSGQGQDVDPELPGLGHFDHVIAYIPGPTPIWIDPTDEFARAGELPDSDQGRMALIAAADTTSLTRTPADESSANRTIETREITLIEDGKGRIVETTEYHGSQERANRRYYAETEAKAIREALEQYVKGTYLAEALGKYETSDPRDLTRPFRLTVEALRTSRAVTSGGEAAVGMFLSRLVADVPWSLQKTDDDEDEEQAEDGTPKKRVNDFVFGQPYVLEIRQRITPAAGYAAREVPENGTIRLGTATITKEFVSHPDGRIESIHRFDSGPRRLTPEQFEEARQAIKEINEERAVILSFDQIGRKHLEAGEVGKAIAEFRRLAELHPREALHVSDIARALLAGGMGSAARREARKAIAIEPKSARAHQILGQILACDLIGRDFGKGFDLDGAIAAYRKAKELDPKNGMIRAELAVLLQRNREGEWYGPKADLAGAITEYIELKKNEDADRAYIDRELMVLYLRSGRFEELRKLTKETQDTEKRDIFAVAAAAALNGPEAGVKASQTIDIARRRAVQTAAGGVLAVIRRYPEAAELLNAAAYGAPNAAELRVQADLMRKVKRTEDLAPAADQPQDLMRELFLAILNNETEEQLNRFVTAEMATVFDDESLNDDARRLTARGKMQRLQAKKAGMSSFMLDVAIAALQIQQDGSEETGIRLLGRFPAEASVPDMGTFVVREDGKYRIGGTSFSPSTLGLQAMRLAQAGKKDAARQWLDWARDYVRTAEGGDDPVRSNAFAGLWTRGRQATDDEVLLAAAALLPDTKKSAELALPVLLSHRERVPAEQQWRVDQALAAAYRAAEKWSDVVVVADRLSEKYPTSASAFELGIAALMKNGRADEAGKRGLARLERLPGDRAALRTLGEVAFRAGDYSRAFEYYGKALEDPGAQALDYNQHAWIAIFAGGDLNKAIEESRQSIALAPSSSASLHTLATLYAEIGKSSEARDALLKSLDAGDQEEPESHDWYVLGRIAENYGIRDEAIEAYRRVTKEEVTAGSSWVLAQKGLERLARAGKS